MFKQLPEGWKEVKLKEVAEINDRDHYTPKYLDKGIPLISPKDFREDGVDLTNLKFVSKEEHANFFRKCHPEKGDILYSRIGTIGVAKTIDFDFDFVALHSIAIIKSKDKKEMNKKFLYYLLKSPEIKKQAKLGTKSIGTPDLGLNEIRSFKFYLPSLETQKQIVLILEKSEALKQKREQTDKLTKEYLKSVFAEMFEKKGFPIEPLKNLVSLDKNSLKRGPFGGSLKKNIFVKQGFKVYEQQNAIYKNMSLGEYYITPEKYKEMIDFSVKPGDFIISCSGTMGKIASIPKNSPEGIINQALLKITLDKNRIDGVYFKFLFESKQIQDYLFNVSHGSGISNFPPMAFIRNLEIPLPPLSLQKKFASIVEQVEKLKEKQKKSEEEINLLFDSLMQRVFKGELVK